MHVTTLFSDRVEFIEEQYAWCGAGIFEELR